MLWETLIDGPRGRRLPPGRALLTGWARSLGFVAAFAVALGLTAPAASAKGLRKPPARAAKKARRPVRERPVPVYTRAGLPNIQARAALILDVTDGAVARSPL